MSSEDWKRWKEKYPEKVRETNRRTALTRKRIKGWVTSKYEGVPCMDCEGVFPFVAMDFDHRPDEDKEFGISNFGMWSETEKNIAIVEIEISKCDLVCSNCHRVRTRDRWKDD